MLFWFAVPISILLIWRAERWPRAQPWVGVAAVAWCLYGLFIGTLRQIGNTANTDLPVFLEIVLPALLVGSGGLFIAVRLGWRRFRANRRP